jgi:hypothetical protein
MSARLAAMVLGALLLAGPAAHGAEIKEFFGTWRGTEVSAPTGLEFQATDLDVAIEPYERGFHMRWTTLDRAGSEAGFTAQPTEASFSQTEQAGVYEYDPGGGSLLTSLFAAPATGNPLDGETLLWARLEESALVVYSLSINADGGFDLNRYARTLNEGGMVVEYRRRIEGREPVRIEGRLERAGD